MAELSFTQLTTTSFRIYVNSLRTNVGKTVYLFDFDKNNNAVRDSVSLDASFPYYYWDINDVSPNTTYNIKVTILYDDGDMQTLEKSYRMSGGGSTLSLTNITSTSLDVQVSGMSQSSYKIITIYLDDDNRVYRDDSIRDASETSATINLTGLTPNTSYEVKVQISYNYGSETLTDSFTTLSGGGSSPSDVWTFYDLDTYSNLSSIETISVSLDQGDVVRIGFTCAYSGTMTLRTSGTRTTVGYLSTSTSFNGSDGAPTTWIANDVGNSTNRNFQITCEVSAGITYYLWVRLNSLTDSGNITVYLQPPEGSSSDDEWSVSDDYITYSNLSSAQELDTSIEAGVVTRIAFSCLNDGDVTIYSEGDLDVVGYLSGIVSFNSKDGRPSSYLTTDDNSGGNGQFSMTYSVTAETSYFLWVRGIDKAISGDVVIYINPPSGSTTERPDYFEWDAPKVSGETFNITASEWKKLLDNIKEVCDYKDLDPPVDSTSDPSAIKSFYYPSKGDEFKASMYNQCIYQFARLGLIDYSDYSVESGDEITAVGINFLKDTINNVE